MNILLVEDHRDIAENIADYGESAGHTLCLAMDGITALALLAVQRFDVLVVDVMLPRMDGLTFLRSARSSGHHVPVLVLTARDTLDDTLAGFDAGADDYLVKPFALPELFARLSSLHRRASASPQTGETRLCMDDLEVDVVQHRARRAGRDLALNRTGFLLLVELLRAAPAPLSRRRLEQVLWPDGVPDSDALKSHLYQVRQVVDRPFARPLIHTVRGVGIRVGLPPC